MLRKENPRTWGRFEINRARCERRRHRDPRARDTGGVLEAQSETDVAVSETIALSDPEVLFEKRSLFGEYDVMPDGRRFIMIDDTETDPAPTQLNLVLNWSDELARLMMAR